ncbi:hypothetical protein ABZ719_31050 [Streptomyces sp. NPDC006743]|uniref:hypothetical protein n=1 Tax=Streptomyces sp. NPDC006743 TaxID=3154480 RepID=UPI0034561B5A
MTISFAQPPTPSAVVLDVTSLECKAVDAVRHLQTDIVRAGALHDPAGMTDDDIARITDSAYAARQAVEAAGMDTAEAVVAARRRSQSRTAQA